MREGAVAACPDDPECRRRAFLGEAVLDRGGEFELAHARLDRREGLLHGAIGNAGIHLQAGEFGVVLAHAQRTERLVGEGMVGAGQRVEQQQREVGAHRLVEHDALRFRGVDRRQRCGKRGMRAIGIGPGVELDVGLLARAFRIEHRHQEGLLARPDQQQARPLVRMRMEAEQPVHMRSRPDRQRGRRRCSRILCAQRSQSFLVSTFMSFQRVFRSLRARPARISPCRAGRLRLHDDAAAERLALVEAAEARHLLFGRAIRSTICGSAASRIAASGSRHIRRASAQRSTGR